MHEQIGKYRILELLGEGGMGAVYAARDLELDRDVAVKVIHKDLADDVTRKRMWREARAAAGLNHPHICQVYEVGESGDELFIAMERLDGAPLSERLESGAIPLEAALSAAIEILDALHVVHGRGLVHRDLKPSNVICTPRGVKLIDFGVVLPLGALVDEGDERLTHTGMMIGTPAFMAPEQWIGSSEVGPAADLFAVGALLFEMVAGRPAFEGRNALEVYNAIARDPAPSLTGGGAIEVVDRVVQRALAKDPAHRPTDARAMSRELEAALPLASGAETVSVEQVRRLAVLGFRLLRPDDEIDFLAVGIPDALVSTLSGRRGLVVKAAGERFDSADPDFAEIARETGAGLVVRGTIQRAGPRLRINAQLVSVPEREIVWSENLDATIDDVFTLQDDLAVRIGDALELRLEATTAGTSEIDVPATGKAYEYFLRANQLSYNFGMLPTARDLYQSALQEDPLFAPAWARLGRVLRVMAKYDHGGDPEQNLVLAEEAFRKALDLSPDLAIAHNLFAYYEIEELGRPEDAMARLLGQARKSPTNPDLLAGLVVACRFCGLLQPSLEADRRARRLDPSIRTSVAYTHFMRGAYEDAMRAEDEDLQWTRHYSLAMLGRLDEAIASCRQAEQRTPRAGELAMLQCIRGALEGDAEVCVTGGERVLASSFRDPEGLYFLARSVVRVGAASLGLDVLERIVAGGLACDRTFAADPWLEPLHADDRFRALVDRARVRREAATTRYRECGGEPLLGAPDG